MHTLESDCTNYVPENGNLKKFGNITTLAAEMLTTIAKLDHVEVLNSAYGVLQTSDNKILALRRAQQSSKSGLWEFPGGKDELGSQKPEQIALSEIFEETGLLLCGEIENHLWPLFTISKKIYGKITQTMSRADIVGFRANHELNKVGKKRLFMSFIFRYLLDKPVEVQLSKEHDAYMWANQEQCMNLEWSREL